MQGVDGRKYVVLLSEGFDHGCCWATRSRRARKSARETAGERRGGVPHRLRTALRQHAAAGRRCGRTLDEMRRADCAIHASPSAASKPAGATSPAAPANQHERGAEHRPRRELAVPPRRGDRRHPLPQLQRPHRRRSPTPSHATAVTYVLTIQPDHVTPEDGYVPLRVEVRGAKPGRSPPGRASSSAPPRLRSRRWPSACASAPRCSRARPAAISPWRRSASAPGGGRRRSLRGDRGRRQEPAPRPRRRHGLGRGERLRLRPDGHHPRRRPPAGGAGPARWSASGCAAPASSCSPTSTSRRGVRAARLGAQHGHRPLRHRRRAAGGAGRPATARRLAGVFVEPPGRDWLLVRDSQLAGRPLAYPFTLGERVMVPSAAPRLHAGEAATLWMEAPPDVAALEGRGQAPRRRGAPTASAPPPARRARRSRAAAAACSPPSRRRRAAPGGYTLRCGYPAPRHATQPAFHASSRCARAATEVT